MQIRVNCQLLSCLNNEHAGIDNLFNDIIHYFDGDLLVFTGEISTYYFVPNR
jgi:hypothetical protein